MNFATARANMIESQVRTNDVSDLALQTAMRAVARESFVVETKREFAYAEVVVPSPSGRALWKPRDFSKLAQAAKIISGERVLVIGGAAGYSAAVFAQMGCSVTIFDNITCAFPSIVSQSGDLRTPPSGPFDVIFVDGGVDSVPDSWSDALAEEGRLCVVILSGPMGVAKIMTKSGGLVAGRTVFDAMVPRLPGFEAVASFSF